MKKILVIGQREFLMAVSEKAFLISLIIYPLLITGINRIRYYTLDEADMTASRVFGVVDRAGILGSGDSESACRSEPGLRYGATTAAMATEAAEKGCRLKFLSYDDLESAISHLRAGKLHLIFAVSTAYPESRIIDVYVRERDGGAEAFAEEASVFQSLLRAGLLRSKIEPGLAEDALKPATLSVSAVARDGAVVAARSRRDRLQATVIPICFAIMLCVWITFSARFMLTATLEERANRVMEVMLSSVKPYELLCRKLIGLGCVALLQVALLMAILNLFRRAPYAEAEISSGVIALCAAFCFFGYLFFAGLMPGAGVIGGGKAAGFLSLTVWAPMILWDVVSNDPNGSAARALSYFPATATIAMVARLNLAPVPLIDIAGSLSLLIIISILSVVGGARIFRAVTLMYGKRVRLSEIARWLREA